MLRPGLENPSTLVTGASGFIGRRLVHALSAGNAEVVAVSRSERPAGGPRVRWVKADLTDAAAVDRLVSEVRPERIFHMSSWVSGRRELENVRPAFAANLASTVNLLVAATDSGCRRIVVAGSMEEPDLAAGEPPSSPYAAAKASAALYARFFHALYRTPVVTARIFMTYGPDQPDASKVVPYAIRSALAGESPRLSSGARPVDWIYVDDVVRGLLALGEAEGVEGESLDLGSGQLITVREVVERICREAGGGVPILGAIPDRPLEPVRVADVERTAARSGFRAEIGLDEGIRRTIAWHRSRLASSEGDSGAASR